MRVISLGGGVQSSRIALGCALGEIEPVQHAIFADTQAEPASVYKWLDWLEEEIQRSPHPFPVHRVSIGSLVDGSLAVRTSKKGETYTRNTPPLFTSINGKATGLLMRQCTVNYKIVPIIRKLRELGGKKSGIVQLIGISKDEAHRAKPSREPWIVNTFPLLDRRETRGHCIEWMDAKGYTKPPRSSCWFCPYHSNAEWRRLRDDEPEYYEMAIQYEEDIKKTYKAVDRFNAAVWLHPSLVPLRDVDLSDDTSQVDMFGNECEGMCGV
jgi:hypothetical protein